MSMKKIGFGVCLVVLTSVLVCAMSRPSQSEPAHKAAPAAAPAVASVSSKVPTNLRGYLLAGLPKAAAQTISASDRVDVLVTFFAQVKDGTKQNVTITLLQNISVLKVGTEGDSAYVVLALSPRDAQYLAVAQVEGKVTVTVRSPQDTDNYVLEISTFSKLFN